MPRFEYGQDVRVNGPMGMFDGVVCGLSAGGDVWVEDLEGSQTKWEVSKLHLLRDPVQSPSHYDLPGGLKVIDVVRDESFLRGNIIKYVLRAPHKQNELEDMKKALRYLTWEIERLENEQSS